MIVPFEPAERESARASSVATATILEESTSLSYPVNSVVTSSERLANISSLATSV